MNCQEIRTAIDEASRRNPLNNTVKAHTAGCPDCRRYVDESNALLALLSTQPRIQAPADFDFRLRARIAQTQVQPSGPVAVLQGFWTRTFSWTQAAAATAALALLATFTALQFTGQQNPGHQNLATSVASAPQANASVAAEPLAAIESKSAPAGVSAPANLKPATVRFNARNTRPAPAVERAEPEASRSTITVASATGPDNSQRFYKRDKGQFINAPNGDLYGAQSSVIKASYVPPSI